jgi:hypothetical protein
LKKSSYLFKSKHEIKINKPENMGINIVIYFIFKNYFSLKKIIFYFLCGLGDCGLGIGDL